MTQLTNPSAYHDHDAPPIEAANLGASYDGTMALDQISFQLSGGDKAAIVGPNGAGKTTLFKIIAGIQKPSTGTIHIYGHRPGSHICVAYVPQRSQVDWEFPVTVSDVVMMGRIRRIGLFRWPKRPDWEIVNAALERVEMITLRGRQIGELSGGQQQRVFLAQAVAQEAEIVMLDEPLNGLDLPSQEAILNILDQFGTMGVTTLVATHDLSLAATHFDKVLLLNRRMISVGEPDQVLTKENLVEAYGGQMHVVTEEAGVSYLPDLHQIDPIKD
jgi:manganese/iron transport system ATP-binding protein